MCVPVMCSSMETEVIFLSVVFVSPCSRECGGAFHQLIILFHSHTLHAQHIIHTYSIL